MWQLVFALRHRLIPQQEEEEQEQEEDAKWVPDGHGLSLDLGHGKNKAFLCKNKTKQKKLKSIFFSNKKYGA